MLAVVVSLADRASRHIGNQLLDAVDWKEHRDSERPEAKGGGTYYRTVDAELRTFDELHLHVEKAAAAFDDPDLLFFASRHSGETGPLLTAHTTGNFGPARFGGAAGELARAAPNALAAILDALYDHAPEGYAVGLECTHHGPSEVGCPSVFVELGSSETEWDDPVGAAAIAQAILDCRNVTPDREKQLVGFGGGHYAPRFERVVRETDWAIGHIAADWSLDEISDPRKAADTLVKAFERSAATHALVDGDHPALRAVIANRGYRIVSETWVRVTDGVPLSTVEALEAELRPVDEGLRFGESAGDFSADTCTIVDLPGELVTEAANVDRDAALAAVSELAIAFETEEGGTRPTGRAALANASRIDIVRALAGVLRKSYHSVEVRTDVVIAKETAFDPEAARELGVEPGPAFGRLANGESVTVDGQTILPKNVQTARERSFSF